MTNELKWDLRFLELAELVASWSKDPSTKVGCVIVLDRFILSTGYNGFSRSLSDDLISRDRKLMRTIHAETNAILTAGRNGISCEGSTLYVTLPSCAQCASVISQSGVARVVYREDRLGDFSNRWLESCEEGKRIFKESGIKYDCL